MKHGAVVRAVRVASGVVGSGRWRRDCNRLEETKGLVVVPMAGGGRTRRHVRSVGGAWGFLGGVLEDRPTGLDGFFQYEGSGIGDETQKRDLRVCLDVFQILGFR